MQLDLNLLTALDALLDEESVTGAAARLHVSAPAMSRTLGRIRRATGDLVLVRTGRTMRPTPHASALREEVRSLVLRSREVLAPQSELDVATLRRSFTLRAHDALTVALAPPLVRRLAEQAPGVTLRFLAESAEDTTDLRRGVVDLELGSSVPSTGDVHQIRVGDDRLVGVSRSGHPFAEGEVDLIRFATVPHVVVSRRGHLRDRIDDLLDAAGHPRTVLASVASTAAAIGIVRVTDAVVVLPASVAHRLAVREDMAVFGLPVALPPVPVVIAWHQRFTPDRGHRWLREQVRAVLEQESAEA